MSRDALLQTNQIALLATGDEISNGDILNTNSQEIARTLYNHGMHVGMHMVTTDTITEIELAIKFLLEHHQVLIITGGLGPTSDDLTRFALSNVLNRTLVFDEQAWDAIVNRLKHFGYATPPESNRQQALFPAGALIIPNPHGTAAGCMVEQNAQLIFMLPGPPAECLPLFNQVVLPKLQQAGFSQVEYHKNWLLFGVSEGQIAEELDALAQPHACLTGYRLSYPYIEFKLHSNQQKDFTTLVSKIEQVIQPYLIGTGQFTASELLREKLTSLTQPLIICDLATGGLLETTLKTPNTHVNLNFVGMISAEPNIIIRGLTEFWQNDKTSAHTQLEIHFNFATQQEVLRATIPFRGSRVKLYAVEFICWKILKVLA